MTIGQPLPRPDGRIKVTGSARYTADYTMPGQLYAALVTAPIASGTLVSLDAKAALAAKGVVHVLQATDLPVFKKAMSPPLASTFLPMQSDEIRYEGQAVAIVLGETLEAAELGARLVRARYQAKTPVAMESSIMATLKIASAPSSKSGYLMGKPGSERGDAKRDFKKGAHRIETAYLQPSRHHNPMEPSATLAYWEGGMLTTHDSVQHGYSVQTVLSAIFGLKPDNVRVICPHTGGGYGSKSYVWPHQILAPAAAKVVNRPVKLVLTRSQFYAIGYQPKMIHAIAASCAADGKLASLSYDAVNATSISDDYVEFVTGAAKSLYACPAVHTSQRVERLNFNVPTYMRAPAEGAGTFPIGCVMDELAEAAGMDPLDFRLASYAETSPEDGRPWSSKKLREAYLEGAAIFGWRERKTKPRRDGYWHLGSGLASCTMGSAWFPSKARVRLMVDGTAIVESGFHDIGAGSLTVFPQIAADALGLDLAKVTVKHGDTLLAPAGPAFGSSSTMSAGTAIVRAADDVRSKLAGMANLPKDGVELRDGSLFAKGGSDGMRIVDIMRKGNASEIVGDGDFTVPGGMPINIDGMGTPFAMRTFGAIFVEVAVDPELGLLRLRRAVGSYSAGKMVNPRTARSQMSGGIIWGWGMAAMEETQIDAKLGRWVSKNLSGVAIPVNADIPSDIKIHFVDEFDSHASPFGGKGIGELGATGVAAAVSNAVYDAIGKRIRSLPITPDKLVTA